MSPRLGEARSRQATSRSETGDGGLSRILSGVAGWGILQASEVL
jgi:hypothetical protein